MTTRFPWLPALAVLLALPAPAVAGGPYDITVTGLESVDPAQRQARFDFVVREIAMTIVGAPNYAVAAMGFYEGEVAFDGRIAFIHPSATTGQASSPWQDLTESGDPDQVVFLPSISVRKGLPASFEIGGDVGWYAGSRQFAIGGFGRWVPFGNWDRMPDVAIGLGYRGLVGNDQLELGVMHLDLSVGYSFKLNLRDTRPGTRFSPFAGYQFLQSHARPGVSVDQISSVSGWSDRVTPGVDPRSFRFHRGFFGMEVRGGAFSFRIAASASFPRKAAVLASIDTSIGLRF